MNNPPYATVRWSLCGWFLMFAVVFIFHDLQTRRIRSLESRVAMLETSIVTTLTHQDKEIAGWRDAFDTALKRIKDGIVVPAPNDLPIGDEWEITITGKRKGDAHEN